MLCPERCKHASLIPKIINSSSTNANIELQTTLLPTAVWGTQFPLVPFMNINTQQYQIVADTDGTIVNADGQQYQMNAGQYLLLNVSRSGMLTSNNPIQMVQIGQVSIVLKKNYT
jgi:hypothetical protein